MDECPCGSGLGYSKCCGRYLEEGDLPETAEALMRSRYTAYTKKKKDYLLKTWHRKTRPQSESFTPEDHIIWTGLQVLATEQGDPHDKNGVVEFVASYIHSGQPGCIREKSRFVRQDNTWLYLDGDTGSEKKTEKAKIGRNAPCPCGSGRKYKKCCFQKA